MKTILNNKIKKLLKLNDIKHFHRFLFFAPMLTIVLFYLFICRKYVWFLVIDLLIALYGSITFYSLGQLAQRSPKNLNTIAYRKGMSTIIFAALFMGYPFISLMLFIISMLLVCFVKIFSWIGFTAMGLNGEFLSFIGWIIGFYFISNNLVDIISDNWFYCFVQQPNRRINPRYNLNFKKYSRFYFYVIYGVLYVFIVSNINPLIDVTDTILKRLDKMFILSIIVNTVPKDMLTTLYTNVIKESMIVVAIIDVVAELFFKLEDSFVYNEKNEEKLNN